MAAGASPPTRRSRSYASAMSCMSAYSMPLCTILTKWPAPSGPTWVTHGTPSTFAAMSVSIGSSEAYASADPPGMMLGPRRAPSSPPEMPAPTKCRPRSRSAASRRRVSAKWELPPSMITSPGSRSGANSSMTASVAAPALTMSSTRRGRSSAATSSAGVRAGWNVPSAPWSARNSSVRAVVRL